MPYPNLSSKSTDPSILCRGCPHDTNRQPSYQMGTPSGACSETAESAMKLLEEENFGKREDYKNVTECQHKELICGDSPWSNGQEADLTGVTTQVTEVSLEPIQQNEGNDALIDDTAPEQVINGQGDEAIHPVKGWDEMKQTMHTIEQYSERCRLNGRAGYYDGFKDVIDDKKFLLDKYKEFLKQYWEQMVEYMEKNPRLRGTPEWCAWLSAGNQFRLLIEPLEIAWCCHRECRDDYLNQRRPKCFELLERWQKDSQEGNPQPRASPSNLTEDSCFWAHVEDACRSCRLLICGGLSVDSERERLRKFEDYVMKLIDNKAVSTDIFLEGSTFMTWWAEYDEILDNETIGHSYESPLAGFMRNEPRCNYCLDEN